MIPSKMLKLLRACKVYIDRPKILLAHQEALNFHDKGIMHVLGIFDTLKCETKLTLIMVMTNFSTVFEFDRALVLNQGKIVESGSVQDLIRNENSEFSLSVKKSDPFIYENLVENLAKILKRDRRERENGTNEGSQSQVYTDMSGSEIDEMVFFNDMRLNNQL